LSLGDSTLGWSVGHGWATMNETRRITESKIWGLRRCEVDAETVTID
jgi:hypothetical protein